MDYEASNSYFVAVYKNGSKDASDYNNFVEMIDEFETLNEAEERILSGEYNDILLENKNCHIEVLDVIYDDEEEPIGFEEISKYFLESGTLKSYR